MLHESIRIADRSGNLYQQQGFPVVRSVDGGWAPNSRLGPDPPPSAPEIFTGAAPWLPVELSVRETLAGAFIVRALDLAIASMLLVVFAPIGFALALVIRLDSPGPAVFRQKRIGKNGELFTFYKFRTLWRDARERYPELYAYDYTPEQIRVMRFKIEDDPRLTRVGRWLRKTSLDEFPNLVNVLKGDLSMVGPRPEIPEMRRYYLPWQQAKWSVKPGVTGLAQTQGRGYLTLQETLYLDVKYVTERDLWSYFAILGRTVWAVFKGIGAF